MTKKLLMGNEAFAHAALEAGVRVVAGYPGTPSSEVIETVARLHASGAARGVHVEWSTNEKAALELLAGASYCGQRTLFTCKQMGLNVASDPLMCVNYIGPAGGMVLFVADDPGPISSQTEQDTRRFGMFAKVPVLDPATPEQAFAMMQAAFDLSERYHTPVIVRPTTRICHASTFFDVADETDAETCTRERRQAAGRGAQEIAEGFARDPKWVIFPKRAYDAHGEINDRLRAMAHDFSHEPALSQFNGCFSGGGEEGGIDGSHDGVCGGSGSAAADGGSHDSAHFGIMAGGVSVAYAREALRMLEAHAHESGIVLPAYRFLQVGTPYPFPEDTVAKFAAGLTEVLVLEELDNVLEDELLAFVGKTHATFDVRGKLTGDARDRGENDVDDVAARIASFFGLSDVSRETSVASCSVTARQSKAPENVSRETFSASASVPASASATLASMSTTFAENVETAVDAAGISAPNVSRETFLADSDGSSAASAPSAVSAPSVPARAFDLPARPPVLCAGCPHRGSFYAVKRALGKTPAVLCGDIGCYTLGNAKPLDAVDTCLCMGAGITMAQGFAVAEPDKKHVAFVGDSTFFASGLTGVANAAYNGHDITVCVLDNATTAMTGAQPHPGTGVTLMGPKRPPISIEAVLRALNFECIVHADPLNLDESIAAAHTALTHKGPSAVLFESPCVQLKRPDPAASVDSERCTGCKKCITEIGCPGLGFDADAVGARSGARGQAYVDASLCNGCGLCTQICPFDALEGGCHA